jgi:hypothetical protein
MAIRRKKEVEHELIAARTELPPPLHACLNHELSSPFLQEA